MTLQDCYINLCGDYNEATSRLMNDSLIDRFVRKFPSDPSMNQLREAIAVGDRQAAFRAVHTLKGVAANLSFTKLHEDATNLTEQLRGYTSDPDPELLAKLEASYEMAIKVLQTYSESN